MSFYENNFHSRELRDVLTDLINDRITLFEVNNFKPLDYQKQYQLLTNIDRGLPFGTLYEWTECAEEGSRRFILNGHAIIEFLLETFRYSLLEFSGDNSTRIDDDRWIFDAEKKDFFFLLEEVQPTSNQIPADALFCIRSTNRIFREFEYSDEVGSIIDGVRDRFCFYLVPVVSIPYAERDEIEQLIENGWIK